VTDIEKWEHNMTWYNENVVDAVR